MVSLDCTQAGTSIRIRQRYGLRQGQRNRDRPLVTTHEEPVLKATPENQSLLLDLQAVDTRLDQLAHQEATLPQTAQLAELTDRLAELNTDVVNASTELSDLSQDVRKAEDEVEQVRKRTTRDQELLDSGSITSGKQLEEIQHEITSLLRRASELEDAQLEVMERAEGAQARVDELSLQIGEVQQEHAKVSAALEVAVTVIRADRADLDSQRAGLAARVPTDLLALYDKLRDSLGGVGAAPLRGSRCEGCHMQLPPTDLKAIVEAEADEVVRCEECRRILIRTAAS